MKTESSVQNPCACFFTEYQVRISYFFFWRVFVVRRREMYTASANIMWAYVTLDESSISFGIPSKQINRAFQVRISRKKILISSSWGASAEEILEGKLKADIYIYIYCRSFITEHLPLLMKAFTIARGSFSIYRSSFLMIHASFIIYHTSFVNHRSSIIVHPASIVLQSSSFIIIVTPHSSLIKIYQKLDGSGA